MGVLWSVNASFNLKKGWTRIKSLSDERRSIAGVLLPSLIRILFLPSIYCYHSLIPGPEKANFVGVGLSREPETTHKSGNGKNHTIFNHNKRLIIINNNKNFGEYRLPLFKSHYLIIFCKAVSLSCTW